METSKQTLCWSCEKACGKCSWSDGTFTPVDGWEAEPTQVLTDHSYRHGKRIVQMESYRVIECPEFVSDINQYKISEVESRGTDYR